MSETPKSWADLETATASEVAPHGASLAALDVPALTVLCHPDVERVGDHTHPADTDEFC